MICEICKRTIDATEEHILSILMSDKRRYIYEAENGTYHITYSGGEVPKWIVFNMLNKGLIDHKWPDRKNLNCFVTKRRKKEDED